MNLEGTLYQFNFIVIFQGVFLAVGLLILKKGDITLNRILGVMLLTFSWSGYYYNIDLMGKMHAYPSIAYTNSISDYVYNPLVFLYVMRLTRQGFKISRKTLLHFLPALLLFGYYANYYFAPVAVKQEIFDRGYNYIPYDVAVFAYGNLLQLVIYLSLSAILLNRYGKQINQMYSNTERRNHNWLKFILIINTVAAVICFFLFGTRFHNVGTILSALSAIMIYAIGYKMISAPPYLPVVATGAVNAETTMKETIAPNKYERSGLSDERSVLMTERVRKFMADQKPYLQPELNLKQMAEMLDMPLHHLSQVLNQYFNKNFYDFINEFRVEEVKARLVDPAFDHLTLLAIGLDCGFNSKASFNNVFKKYTGKSPSEFKKSSVVI